MLLLVIQFVILDANNYFILVAFQMAWPTLQTITMRHCKEKVVHVLLFFVHFAILNVDNYLAFVAFQMA